jgi:YVTN family beta-propeller protein
MAVDEQIARLFITNDADGTVSMLDTRHGTLLRTISVGGFPRQIAVDARAGHVLVLRGDDHGGAAVVLDARSGAILRIVPIHLSLGRGGA